MRVLDGAVVVFDGKMGVECQSETVWRQADKYGVPRICFINKINQTGGDFYKSLDSIHDRLNKRAFPIHLPIGFEQSVNGVVDLISMKAYTYKEFTDHELVEGEIPDDMLDKAKKYRSLLIENAVAEDEKMLEKYLEVGEEGLSEDEIKQAIRSSRADRQVLRCHRRRWPRRDSRKTARRRQRSSAQPVKTAAQYWGTHPKTGDEIERKPEDPRAICRPGFQDCHRPVCRQAGLLPGLLRQS